MGRTPALPHAVPDSPLIFLKPSPGGERVTFKLFHQLLQFIYKRFYVYICFLVVSNRLSHIQSIVFLSFAEQIGVALLKISIDVSGQLNCCTVPQAVQLQLSNHLEPSLLSFVLFSSLNFLLVFLSAVAMAQTCETIVTPPSIGSTRFLTVGGIGNTTIVSAFCVRTTVN